MNRHTSKPKHKHAEPSSGEPMTPKEYDLALVALGLSQRMGGRFLGHNERTSRRWIAGDAAIPARVARILRLMVRKGMTPDDIVKTLGDDLLKEEALLILAARMGMPAEKFLLLTEKPLTPTEIRGVEKSGDELEK